MRVATINLNGTSTVISKNKTESSEINAISEPLSVPEIFRINVSELTNVTDDRQSNNEKRLII